MSKKRYRTYNKFTFGKYKGRTFASIRKENPSYLEWVWNTIGERTPGPLYKYIQTNLEAIMQESNKEKQKRYNH